MRLSAYPLSTPEKFTTLRLLAEQPALPFFDVQKTPEREEAKQVVQMAFAEAVRTLEAWETRNSGKSLDWGNYKATSVLHLAQLPALSRFEVFCGGNRGIVNATSERHGPSWRMVVELTPNGPNAWGVYPGGQSGNPGSPYYDNLLEQWRIGAYYPMSLMQVTQQADAWQHIEYLKP